MPIYPQAPPARVSISDMAACAAKLPPRGKVTPFQMLHCPLLPSMDGESWGRDCRIKKLNVQEQIDLIGRVRDGVTTDRKRRAEGDMEAPRDDSASYQFHESLNLLVLGCVEPFFDESEAVLWMTTDEVSGIGTANVLQFLLFHIRSINEEQEGLEDVAAGLAIMRRMPGVLQSIEHAYLAGPEALKKLLEGDNETAQYIERWGGIISHVVLENVRKRAKIEAEESATLLLEKITQFLLDIGYLKRGNE